MIVRLSTALFFVSFLMFVANFGMAQEDPARKLAAFAGKWQSEGTFANGNQVASALECRWSVLGDFLLCEQAIKMSGGDHHQLTVYSYSSKDQNYSYTTIGDPGARPTSGLVQINGNLWTYATTFENNGKTVQVRTTNEFTNPRTEVFKVESSDDGGATWKTQLQGTAHKVGD
ncbi:MAG TPA: DUF1579 family protein [Candidatus Angelobacter sp.]|nr:DUF1579 family protein [Candidatus Angelobacter sp.]